MSKIAIQIQMSRGMRKPTFCICENKDADQLRGNREADQRLCFLSHLLIARCDIGVQLSVRPFVRPSVRPQFMSRCLLCSSDSWEYETLHSNYP